MKTSRDPRHIRRQHMIQSLFSYSFQKKPPDPKILPIVKNLAKIDKEIENVAPSFPIEKINRVDLAVLRLGTYELLLAKREPPKVVIDEAVELAKEFGGESSPAFVNGALGKLMKQNLSRGDATGGPPTSAQ